MKRLLDQYGGITEYFHYDDTTDTAAIEIKSDVEPTIERNKRLQIDTDGYSNSRELRHVASIPMVVIEIWKKRHGADPLAKGNEDLLKRLLNDPDLRYFRVGLGRV